MAAAEGIGAIVMEGRRVYKPSLSRTRERERVLYAGASSKEFVIRSRRDEYRIAERSDGSGLNLRL